ncbi:DUF2590 family protein [Klebsiella oxytoca]|uniref:DUF2590 family protein n=1 Tax=Klebsiella oxytoca TaxID=571 RepID=UPI0018C7C590|nr:DUF2590 family protein [Klebsiella oxytoca]MBG2650453.1 DUF2590 family protein [Klebsiella oxytoca]
MNDEKELYFDLLITDKNFTLNPGNEPVLCKNRDSIGQDIIHMIIESALTKQLIAERSRVLRGDVLLQLELLVETDVRIVAGTVRITEGGSGRYLIAAETRDFGPTSGEFNA